MIRVRVVNDHRPLRGYEWQGHEWYFTGDAVKADRLGRRNPRMHSAGWLVVRCTNMTCWALAVVNMEDVLALLPPAPQSKPLGVAP